MSITNVFAPDNSEIIKSALELLRVTDIENTANQPTANQYARALQTLLYMVSAWQADGMQLWLRTTSSFVLAQGQQSYLIGPSQTWATEQRPLQIYQAWRHDVLSTTDVPLAIYSENEYMKLPNKTSEGMPVALYYDPKYDAQHNSSVSSPAYGQVYLWQPANQYAATNVTIFLRYQREFWNFNATTDHVDFPKEWLEAVKYGLALRLGPVYGIPMLEYDRLKRMADEAKELAMSFDQEKTSVYVQPANDKNRR